MMYMDFFSNKLFLLEGLINSLLFPSAVLNPLRSQAEEAAEKGNHLNRTEPYNSTELSHTIPEWIFPLKIVGGFLESLTR